MPISLLSQESKYTRKNREPDTITYSKDKCYSRSIKIKDGFLYTANSNGSLYRIDLQSGISVNLMENKKFEEMRDLELVGDTIIGMQSGTYGVLAILNNTQFLDYVIPSGNIWHSVFLDGIDFKGRTGFAMGDPKKGIFTLSYSTDGGMTWTACKSKMEAMDGEAGFAASGTNVQVLNDSTFTFVSGGKKSRFFITHDRGASWKQTSLPYLTSLTSGAFSIYMKDSLNGVIVGGDFANPDLNLNNAFFTDDGGEFWINAEKQPRGYRSCVYFHEDVLYSCGTNGIDVSFDMGREWIPFANGNFFALTSDDMHLYATIPNGKIVVFELAETKK
jgi:hypothetical protein